MTTARKVWFGFGTVLTLLLISSLLNVFWLTGIRSNLTEIADVAEPASEAAFEMEIRVQGTGMAVLQYLDTGAGRFRESVARDKDQFRNAKNSYNRLTSNPDLTKQLGDLYERYYALGVGLMDTRDRQQELFATLSWHSDQTENLLNREIRTEIDRSGPAGLSKVEEANIMKAQAASIGSWMGHYRRIGDPAYEERMSRHQRQLSESLGRFQKLPLTEREKEWADKLAARFQEMFAQVGQWLDLHKTQRARLQEFLAVGAQLDDVLDKEIRAVARQELRAAKAAAEDNVNAVLGIKAATLLGSLALGLLVSLVVGRGILNTEALLRVSLTSIGDAMILTDADGAVTFLNPAAESLTGWGLDEAVGKPLATVVSLVHEATRQPVGDVVQLVKQQGVNTALANNLCLQTRDKVERLIEGNAAPIRDAQDNVLGIALVFRDITARRQAERERERTAEALRESENWLHELANAMPQIVFSARPEGTFDYFNQQWYEFTGTKEGDSSQGWKPILHPDDLQRWQDHWAETVRKGTVYQIECRLRNGHSGGYRWHLCRALPVRNQAGEIVRWYGTCTDIDQQKRNEVALMVADRRKDEFLAVLSHELRNPLAPIRNALQLLRMGKVDDPDLTEARDVIDRQVTQLAGIVDDLLDVFRITHQKMAIHKEALDLAHLVRQTVEDHRPSMESTRLALAVEAPDEPVWVHGDQKRLCQVMTNLLNNAAKYTNPGDRVTVRVAVDVPNQRTFVTVLDTGIGIEPRLLPHIFDTFIQGEQSLDRRGGGLGLGLPLVKGIVELHGGSVNAASAGPGQGTEITFWLPLGQKPRVTAKAPAPVVTSAKPLRILIIEDNADAARTLAKLLMRYGHEVTTAYHGPAGLESARALRPEVVLCDLGLPEMDGYEVARTLRSDPATQSIRLIAVSGYGQDEDRRRSEEAGFDLHLTKPVDPSELQRLLAVLKVGP